jgi:hypothetical protein
MNKFPLFLAVAVCCWDSQSTAKAASLISLEPPLFQSRSEIESSWNAIPETKKEAIQTYLLSIGLSSTGRIQLIGTFRYKSKSVLLQFQQADLEGTRLFWSVLIDTDSMAARVIYHTNQDMISEAFTPILKQ